MFRFERVKYNSMVYYSSPHGRHMLGRAAQAVLSRTARVPAFRPPQARAFSGVPGKEQLNAAAARAGDEAASLGASIGENVQKLQWWTSAKVRPPGLAASDRAQ